MTGIGIGRGVGAILVVCANCGLVFHMYAIGDENNRKKFGGVPTPSRALSGLNGRGGVLECPRCHKPLFTRPVSAKIMSVVKFNRTFDIVEEGVARVKVLVRRLEGGLVDENIRASVDVSQGLAHGLVLDGVDQDSVDNLTATSGGA